MPGTVVKVFVETGQKVKKGQSIVSIESMKMEYVLKATHDCTIGKIDCKAG
jgi:biotin carboxyl carrier protein